MSRPEVDQLQHLGGLRFKVVIRSRAAVSRILEAGSLSIGEQVVPIISLGPQVVLVYSLYLPRQVRNETLAASLKAKGKVFEVTAATHVNRPTVRTGTRIVKFEMKESNPVPNFMRVAGHRVTMDYRGLKKICRVVPVRDIFRHNAKYSSVRAVPCLAMLLNLVLLTATAAEDRMQELLVQCSSAILLWLTSHSDLPPLQSAAMVPLAPALVTEQAAPPFVDCSSPDNSTPASREDPIEAKVEPLSDDTSP